MFDVREYAEKVNQMRKQGGCITNNFLPVSTLKSYSEQEDSKLLFNEDAIAIICADNGVSRIYFCISSLEKTTALRELMQNVTARPLVAEYIGKQPHTDVVVEKLRQAGFSVYTTMNRWRSTKIKFFAENLFSDRGFRQANSKDVDGILKILQNVFDAYVSHLPSKKGLEKLIDNGLVFCLDIKDEVVAVVCLERIGKNGIYLYQDAVVKKYQNTGVGILLIQFALSHFKDANNYTSWVECSNSASNRMHQQLGLTRDGLKCVVLLYQ